MIHLVLLRLPLSESDSFLTLVVSRPSPSLDLWDGSCLYLSVAASSVLPNLTGVSNPHSTSVVSGRSGQAKLAHRKLYGCVCVNVQAHAGMLAFPRYGMKLDTSRDDGLHNCREVNHDLYNPVLLSEHEKPLGIHCFSL